ncbi:MAG: TetR/AcrR family transcriptional regulator, partial [Gammaproteobacteria bacterium]
MSGTPAPTRTRNAAATRQAILDAAMHRFAKEGYDGASLREIASDAGVDAALVSRYFGSKEELFVEVLNCGPDASELFQGELTGFGERVADRLMDDPDTRDGLDHLLIMLRSASSP